MVVCVCNVLMESAVKKAIESGAKTYDQVLGHLESEPVCWTCQALIEEMLHNASV